MIARCYLKVLKIAGLEPCVDRRTVFGPVNELGVFAMTEQGLKEVKNPSAIFLNRDNDQASGSVVMVVWEGTRPLLVEIQALVDDSQLGNPRRVAVGLEQNRLAMLLAVLHRHGGLAVGDQDVFVECGWRGQSIGDQRRFSSAVGHCIQPFRDNALPQDLVVFGEVGLAGEIRPVPSGQERIQEAAKHGFKRAIVPASNVPKTADRRDGNHTGEKTSSSFRGHLIQKLKNIFLNGSPHHQLTRSCSGSNQRLPVVRILFGKFQRWHRFGRAWPICRLKDQS